MRRRGSATALALVVAAAALAAVAWAKLDEREGSTLGAVDPFAHATGLPQPVPPAFRPPRPRLLADRGAAAWAPVRVRSVARVAPGTDARPIAALETLTPEGTSNLVLVLGREMAAGGTWVRVRLPILPNNSTGWVRRADLGGYHFVHTHLVIDVDRLTATLFDHGHVVFRTRVGVGAPATPTPVGEFYVRDKLTRYRSPFYGPVAFGTSARSAVLTDWPNGGYVGIHGTSEPELLPGRVSHGCIRMANAAILRLSRMMPIGTPLTIR